MFQAYDVVRLVSQAPGCEVDVGTTGTVLMVFDEGDGVAYEVEFVGHWKEMTYTLAQVHLEPMEK